MKKQNLIILILIFLLPLACKHNAVDSQPPGPTWTFLGLSGKPIERLVVAEPYIYACARGEGLWRLNLQKADTNWVYLGLADTSLNRQQSLGVVDVVISNENSDWLLAIARPTSILEGAGVFRSVDQGKTWSPILDGLEFDGKQVYPHRLLQYANFVISSGRGVVFKSSDFGLSWTVLHGEGPVLLEIEVLTKHPIFDHIIWLGGYTGFGATSLSISTDFGKTWNEFFPLPSFFNFGVSDIALHPIDSLVVYVAAGSIIAKSIDMGNMWKVVLQEGSTAMLIDTRNTQHIWSAWGNILKETYDSGLTWQEWSEPPPEEIAVVDLVWDDERKVVYLGGWLDGVYRFVP